jgi:hypothetical protein
MEKKTKVIIDPSCRVLFSSFYIEGIYNVFGRNNVSFSLKYFKELKRKEESHSYDHYMAFVVIHPNNNKIKIVIDFRDKPSIKESAYEWCDKYCKINFNESLTDKKFHAKIISIPPGFGVKIWNFFETLYYCCFNLFLCKFSTLVSWKMHFKDYYSQYNRPMLKEYLTDPIKSDIKSYNKPYVFMVGTLWAHKNCVEGTNLVRKKFADICKSLNCDFEGGFFADFNHPQYKEFESLIFTQTYSIEDYINKTKLSIVVFNTPAVHNCHGWKLGEYIAMGKAIISTPLLNKLPEDLLHGKNIHFVSNEDELRDAIGLLLTNDNYRKLLEEGTKYYYNKYLNPESVIRIVCKYI